MKQLPKRGQPVTVRLMSRNQTDLKSGARWGHEAKVRVKVRAQAQAQEQAEAKAKWVRAQLQKGGHDQVVLSALGA